MNTDLLKFIVESSKANIGGNNPHGFCYVEGGHAAALHELVSGGVVQANMAAPAADGSIPVRPTEAGVKLVADTPNHPAPLLPAPVAVNIEMGIPVPDRKTFGRQSDGNDKVTQYKFAEMQVNASFFIPQPVNADKPIHRTFSAIVSQANKKLFPRNFVIREWEGGARVWRLEDLTEARPTRPRKAKPAEQAAAQPNTGAQFPGGFPAPGNPGFGATQGGPFMPQPGAFDAGGFAPPAEAPGTDWGQGPGFDPGLPQFGE